jgi:ATP-dependent DNA helicase RecQ
MLDNLKAVIAQHWGFRTLRPLQEPAMHAVLDGRDSLVVMPTGGGKSLCYQAPAVVRGDSTTVVVSPLISLMKDQVDSLKACGVAAVQFDSTQTDVERQACQTAVIQGKVRLLFTSPERLVTSSFQNLLQKIQVRTFAIDEAHCISHWGHDFRPEYRQLSRLQELFPQASVHAYTATATERVRRDIIQQLRLRKPEVLVGNFDRPNLTYRVIPRRDIVPQVLQVLDRHQNEAGIIYCIRRKDVDDLANELRHRGINARPYHAGMAPEDRKAAQDAFSKEECNPIVATVAFGMGIDRSNIRFVLHAGMPKSVEHYQQETGRAGRDGLEAECVLLYSGADYKTWEFILTKAAEGQEADEQHLKVSLQHVRDMTRYCSGAVCRHRALVQYFGQSYGQPSCAACDLCLGDMEVVPDATIVAQKILSCVARVKESFGVNHVAHVLHGRAIAAVASRGHDQLSTFGLLKDEQRHVIQEWIRQLIGQQLLDQVGDEYPILKLNAASWEIMKGQHPVRLVRPLARRKDEGVRQSKAGEVSWEGVDRVLFDSLRELRQHLAQQRGVPPYVLFHDGTLRQLAAVRPSSLEKMKLISGVGEAKLRDLGQRFLSVITNQARARRLPMDVPYRTPDREEAPKGSSRLNPERSLAFKLFRQSSSIDDVIHWTGRAKSTVIGYLAEFIRQERPASIDTWVQKTRYEQIAGAARRVGSDRLKPIYVALGEKVPYEDIRLVLAHLGLGTAPAEVVEESGT